MKKLLLVLFGIIFVLSAAWCAFAWDYVRREERDVNRALALVQRCEADHATQAVDGMAQPFSNCTEYLEEDRRKESGRIVAAAITGVATGVAVALLFFGGRRFLRRCEAPRLDRSSGSPKPAPEQRSSSLL